MTLARTVSVSRGNACPNKLLDHKKSPLSSVVKESNYRIYDVPLKR